MDTSSDGQGYFYYLINIYANFTLQQINREANMTLMETTAFHYLDSTEFEEFCSDLLSELGFINIDWRKGTGKASSPSDRGRDIVCQYVRKDVDGATHLETWFVDCKHYQRGIPPTELENLLAWSHAEGADVALIIASNFLSNPAKDFLSQYQKTRKPGFKIKYWERPQLEKWIQEKKKLAKKYAHLRDGFRSLEEIWEAEREYFDRVWYDRSLMNEGLVQRGKITIRPDIREGAKKSETSN